MRVVAKGIDNTYWGLSVASLSSPRRRIQKMVDRKLRYLPPPLSLWENPQWWANWISCQSSKPVDAVHCSNKTKNPELWGIYRIWTDIASFSRSCITVLPKCLRIKDWNHFTYFYSEILWKNIQKILFVRNSETN